MLPTVKGQVTDFRASEVAKIASALVNGASPATTDLLVLSTVAALGLVTLARVARALVTLKVAGMVPASERLAAGVATGTLLDLGTALGLVVGLSTEAAVGGARARAAITWARVTADLAGMWAAVATSPAARIATAVRQHIRVKLRVARLATKAAGLGRHVRSVLAARTAPVLLGLARPLLDAVDMEHSVALGAVVDGLLALDNIVADHAFILI